MQFVDRMSLDAAPRRDGERLVAVARVARAGVQTYDGAELGMADAAAVRVWRPETEVFAKAAMETYARIPVTVGHPAEPVTADTWKRDAVGETGEEVLRDGEYVRVPLIVRDAAAMRAIEDGRRELSMGYLADIDWTPGKTLDGQEYDAVQRNMAMNHVAIVDRARGGAELRIGDAMKWGAAPMSDQQQRKPDMPELRKLMVDGLSVETTEQGAVAIEKLQKVIADHASAMAAKEADAAAARKAVEAKDGEIAALRKQLADAEMTPAKMAEAVKARAVLLADAARIAPKVEGLDAMSDADVRRSVVAVALGDAVKAMSDEAVAGAFSALAAAKPVDPFRDAVSAGIKAQDGAATWDAAVFKRAGVPMAKGA